MIVSPDGWQKLGLSPTSADHVKWSDHPQCECQTIWLIADRWVWEVRRRAATFTPSRAVCVPVTTGRSIPRIAANFRCCCIARCWTARPSGDQHRHEGHRFSQSRRGSTTVAAPCSTRSTTSFRRQSAKDSCTATKWLRASQRRCSIRQGRSFPQVRKYAGLSGARRHAETFRVHQVHGLGGLSREIDEKGMQIALRRVKRIRGHDHPREPGAFKGRPRCRLPEFSDGHVPAFRKEA